MRSRPPTLYCPGLTLLFLLIDVLTRMCKQTGCQRTTRAPPPLKRQGGEVRTANGELRAANLESEQRRANSDWYT
jgi:hypothetical protein